MPAQYLVTQPPGAPVPQVGFVNIGQIFTAPEGYTPSLTFRPANEEGREVLKKLFAERKTELERRRDRAKELRRIEDQEALIQQLEALEVQRKGAMSVFRPVETEPAVRDGATLKELAELDAKTQSAIGPKTDVSDPKGGSAAAKGDRKL